MRAARRCGALLRPAPARRGSLRACGAAAAVPCRRVAPARVPGGTAAAAGAACGSGPAERAGSSDMFGVSHEAWASRRDHAGRCVFNNGL